MFKAIFVTSVALMLSLSLAQSFPTTVEHKYGSTTIEEQPQRVLALGYNDLDALFAVDVPPVAVRYWFADYPNAIFPWAQPAANGATPEILNMPELNFEAILSVDPDLIVAAYSGLTKAEYDQLSQIAPTVAQSADYDDYEAPWQDMTLSVGQSVGKGTEAQAAVDQVESAFSEARAANPTFEGKSIAVTLFNDVTNYNVYQSQENRARFFTELGFEVPATFDALAGDSFFFVLTDERLDLLNEDVLVIISYTDPLEVLRENVESDELMSQLDVVQDDRVVYVTGADAEALGFSSVLSLPYALEGILPDLIAAAGE